MPGIISTFRALFTRPAPAAGLERAIGTAFKAKMTPHKARLTLRSAINAQYPLNHWMVPRSDAADQAFRRYQIGAPGLDSFQKAVAPALACLSNRPQIATSEALRAELSVAMEKCQLAEAHFVPRLQAALAADDRDTIALCTAILGENHPEIAYLRDPQHAPLPQRPSVLDPLAGPLQAFALLQAVLMDQDVGTLRAFAIDRYQYAALQDYRPDTPEKVMEHLNDNHTPLSDALDDATRARQYTPLMADATQRRDVEAALDDMIAMLTKARDCWRSVLTDLQKPSSRALQDMACAWLGENDATVMAHRQTVFIHALQRGEQRCESFREEQAEAWDEIAPLSQAAFVVDALTPPAPAPAAAAVPSFQDPSIARLLEARSQRAAPFRAFIEDMMEPQDDSANWSDGSDSMSSSAPASPQPLRNSQNPAFLSVNAMDYVR